MPTHLQCTRGLTVHLLPGYHTELHKPWGADGINFIPALTVTKYAHIMDRLLLQYTAMDRVMVMVDIFHIAAGDWLIYNVLTPHFICLISGTQFDFSSTRFPHTLLLVRCSRACSSNTDNIYYWWRKKQYGIQCYTSVFKLNLWNEV